MTGSTMRISTALDLSSDFNELLKKNEAPPIQGGHGLNQIDEFLKEAYRIVSRPGPS